MHIEAVQRYTLNFTEEEGRTLLSELSKVPLSHTGSEMLSLYETLEIWFGQ